MSNESSRTRSSRAIAMTEAETRPADKAHHDPITGEAGSQPVGTGVTAAGALSGPFGALDPVADFSRLIESMAPQAVPTPSLVLQARRNSAARAELIQEFELLTSGQISEINESAAGNRAALASRWKAEGKIFSVTYRGATYYPGFQFAPGGRPRPLVARVLQALGGDDGWETALWFTAANGYLGGARPVDLLERDPEAVVEAARRDVEAPY